VTVGGLNQVKMFCTDDFSQAATIALGNLPHSIWPSGDDSCVYVGLQNAEALAAVDTLTNKVIATVPIGQAPQGRQLCFSRQLFPPPDLIFWRLLFVLSARSVVIGHLDVRDILDPHRLN
jgi:YVTN family beta-propeller protein